MKIVSRKTLCLVATVIVALAIGFAGGSFWMTMKAQVQTRNRFVNSWGHKVELLAGNWYTARVLSPEQVALSVGGLLDAQSMALAYIYDELPQQQQNWIARYVKAARNIAIAQQGKGFMHDRKGLLIFVDCVQKIRSHGGSVRKCAMQKGMYEYGPDTTSAKQNSAKQAASSATE